MTPSFKAQGGASARVCLSGEDLDWLGGVSVCLPLKFRTKVGLIDRPSPADQELYSEVWRSFRNLGLVSGPSPTFVVDTDIPSSIGLASSSAGVVAAAIAVNSRFALGLSEEQILRIAYETEFVGTGGGGMDHIASVSADVSVTDGCDGFLPRRSEGRYEWKADWLVSLVIPPGTKDCRNHIKEVRSWQKYDPARIGAYRSAVTVASKMILRAIDQDDIALLGASMDAAHQAMRDLFAMSTETLETERSKVLRAGAAGVKLTGSGGGGCLVVVTQQDRHPEFVEQWLGLRSNASAARLVSNVGRHREKIG